MSWVFTFMGVGVRGGVCITGGIECGHATPCWGENGKFSQAMALEWQGILYRALITPSYVILLFIVM